MAKLQGISTISSEAIELLEAVGYLDSFDLLDAEASELHAELVKANDTLKLLNEPPTLHQVQGWQEGLMREEGSDMGSLAESEAEPQEEKVAHVNFEKDAELLETLEAAPALEFLSGGLVRQHELAVRDIPEGILLTHCRSDLEINVAASKHLADEQRRTQDATRKGLVTSRIRSVDEADSEDHVVKPLERGKPREAVSVSEGLNKGLSPESKRFVRGVLHPEPTQVRVGAFFAILVILMLLVAFLGIPAALYYEKESGTSMFWPVIGVAIALVLAGIGYALWSINSRCRICGQKHFMPKKCLKHVKAHRFPLIGYILPTALHALLFSWFYCTYCGTAVRLKK